VYRRDRTGAWETFRRHAAGHYTMTVLIIGSSGYLGEYVIAELLSRGRDVVGFDLNPGDTITDRAAESGTFEAIRGDMTSFADLSDVITTYDITEIIQLAYFGTPENGLLDSAEEDPYHASNSNITGFNNILETARQFGINTLVWASSTVVYGFPEYYTRLNIDDIDEESPTHPESLYGACKVKNEHSASLYRKEYDIDVAGIRLPLIYGPERYPGAQPFIVDMFETVARGGDISLENGETTWDLLYEKDIGPLFSDILEQGSFDHAVYNIFGHTVTVRELAEFALKHGPSDAQVDVTDGSNEVLPAPIDDSRFRAEFDFRPTYDAEQAVTDYLTTLNGRDKT
jgi:nucleoside-diphosphate-sugar epimerase